jgi:hypothetical protein
MTYKIILSTRKLHKNQKKIKYIKTKIPKTMFKISSLDTDNVMYFALIFSIVYIKVTTFGASLRFSVSLRFIASAK